MTNRLTISAVTASLLVGLISVPRIAAAQEAKTDPQTAPSRAADTKNVPMYARVAALRDLSVTPARGPEDATLGVVKDVLIDARSGQVVRYVVQAASPEAEGAQPTAAAARRLQAVEPKAIEWTRGPYGEPAPRAGVTQARFTASPEFDLAKLRESLGAAAVRATMDAKGGGAAAREASADPGDAPAKTAEAIAAAGRAYRLSSGLQGLEVRGNDGADALGTIRELVLHADGHRVAFAALAEDKSDVLIPWSKLELRFEGEGESHRAYLAFDGDAARIKDAPREGEVRDATLAEPRFRAAILRHFGVAPTERK